MDYYTKYQKYKDKYINLKMMIRNQKSSQFGGATDFQAQTPYGLDRKAGIGYYLIDVPVVDLQLDNKLKGFRDTNEVAFVTFEKKDRMSVKITVVWNLQIRDPERTDKNDRTFHDYQEINESKIKQVAIEKLKSDPQYSFLYLP